MARIAIVQSYPYESVKNGDASYIQSIRDYLIGLGHEVHSITTDMKRGRSRAYYRSHYDFRGSPARTRGAIRVGDTFVSRDPFMWLRMARRVFIRSGGVMDDGGPGRSEGRWLRATLRRLAVDRVILLMGAVGFEAEIKAAIPHIVAVPLYLSNRSMDDGTGAVRDDDAALDAEVAMFAGAACVGVHSHDDAEYLRARGLPDVIRIGIGVAPPGRARAPRVIAEPVILFVAAAAPQNRLSIDWFLGEVWPLVLARRPDARLRVVGGIAGTIDPRAHSRIEAVGFVDDLQDEYHRVRLAIAPLTKATRGMKVKVAEAIAFACPLVTTSLGMDPAEADWVGRAALIADGAGPFADAVVRLLNDDALCATLSSGAETAYRDHLAFDAVYRTMMERLALGPADRAVTRS